MKNNRLTNIINFLAFLNAKKGSLYQEYRKSIELQELMQKGKVDTVFQPILSLKEGMTLGFEILNRPQPTELFPTTEKFYEYVGKSNDVFMIERFLRNLSLERFSDQVKGFQHTSTPLVFLNIQPQVLADPAYRSGITLELLEIYNLCPEQIVLELTEKEAVTNYSQFERIIDHYRQQGFRIAVDDAGTGYNSLQTLIYIKPEFIKLDKSLIRKIDEHPEKQHLVELLFDFAIQSNTQIVAEGIESLSELKYLRKLGVHMGQGFALGKPNPELINGKLPHANPILRTQFA
ncbi:EAL domain-containing protein [Bacillus sp. DTU_2020_1000418_1_SI_GHA_SEK_038]|uniref:EAL domain-containing protein n=1 Tax=Bacillus sp. DTU_2020_1000418_1_SI_GHA_SEK_038 TaxID=3077585 RepID=UPI0028EDDB90|nr:EAL domain-containing protein [Bacillus sp. DTU_2020_1000418_1_SI_GHA_SEK_038]WNS76082.1 EAL domain-containing protein [Bacillus sp. DTU_2020_1000418_1_SI_GHA_SEK_038]